MLREGLKTWGSFREVWEGFEDRLGEGFGKGFVWWGKVLGRVGERFVE